jgi:hypothetical protein
MTAKSLFINYSNCIVANKTSRVTCRVIFEQKPSVSKTVSECIIRERCSELTTALLRYTLVPVLFTPTLTL